MESGEHASACPLLPSLLVGQGVNLVHIFHVTGCPQSKHGVEALACSIFVFHDVLLINSVTSALRLAIVHALCVVNSFV